MTTRMEQNRPPVGRRSRLDMNPADSNLALGLLAGVTAVLAGIVLAFGGPIAGAGVLLGGLATILVLRNIELGFFGVIAVVALLPFATLPFDIGLTPTFLDFALGAAVLVWLLGIVTGKQRRIITTPIALPRTPAPAATRSL
ncbi:MAG TPA: hypothetical protein PKJ56_04525, partial [Promineifilum sp.]|nr:hypothetical protein [Promineifilum sp.]